MSVDAHSAPAQKIALFRSLFRGRDDVYPRRFESRATGRSGYAPACGNEWVRGVCEKPRVACAECSHRRFLPVTDEVVRWHLSGADAEGRNFVLGCYPLLLDETCFFLAMDFDGEAWQLDASAVMDTCRRLDLPAALERSRSGKGAHIWLFFSEALPATLARKMGAHVLTETMDRRPDIGLKSYDRLFPNQDTLPIAFDGWSSLEVDFYSADLRLALEVDGDQHLGDRDAWRRDRRKDALLQENGCMVLRFLAEDLGRDLDRVLDTILRAVAFRHRRAS